MVCGLVYLALQARRRTLTDALAEQVQIGRRVMTKSASETSGTQKAKNLREEVSALCVGAPFKGNADRRALVFYLDLTDK